MFFRAVRDYFWRPPATFDEIADDFIFNQNIWRLDQWPKAFEYDDGFALRRRLAYIYGVSTCYGHHAGLKGARGWNRRLWKSIGDKEPEQVVDELYEFVKSKIKKAADDGIAEEFNRRVRRKKRHEGKLLSAF